MNIFNKYGIKEVADVTFYSIARIGDEEFLTPVLFFDTLKVSTLNKSVETVNAMGGKGNGKIISWNFGKDLKLKLEDALFSEASMDMYMNGHMQSKLSPYLSIIAKSNVANKYGKLHYSIKAYPSPELTEEEWDIIYRCAEAIEWIGRYSNYRFVYKDSSDQNRGVAENRFGLRHDYVNRLREDEAHKAMPQEIIDKVLEEIDSLKKIGYFQDDLYEAQSIDRMEKCIVTSREGFTIDPIKQKEALKKHYDDVQESYTIYYDPKTMMPFFGLDSEIKFTNEKFTLKYGTVYFKFTRTVTKLRDPDTMLGIDLKINAEVFPAEYKVVGETFIREQKTGKDQRYQFVIKRAKISPSTNIELKADGGPTTFSMDIDVLMPKDKHMFELRQFDVEEDKREGGTKIVPQQRRHSYTKINPTYANQIIENNEIY